VDSGRADAQGDCLGYFVELCWRDRANIGDEAIDGEGLYLKGVGPGVLVQIVFSGGGQLNEPRLGGINRLPIGYGNDDSKR
jgi:hypothetical protein